MRRDLNFFFKVCVASKLHSHTDLLQDSLIRSKNLLVLSPIALIDRLIIGREVRSKPKTPQKP